MRMEWDMNTSMEYGQIGANIPNDLKIIVGTKMKHVKAYILYIIFNIIIRCHQ